MRSQGMAERVIVARKKLQKTWRDPSPGCALAGEEKMYASRWSQIQMKIRQLFISLLPLLSLAVANGQSTINDTYAFAWGGNIGWTNWKPDATNGVSVGEYICSGYVYGANVGWINLGSGSPINHIQYQNNSATDFGLNYGVDPNQPGYGILRGYAYGANIGWIVFEASGNPRVRFSDGALDGYAYSANCGWINLGDLSQHNLRTNSIAKGVDSDNDGMADAFEYQYFGSLAADPTTDTDGDGIPDLQEYQDGTDPTQPNDGFRITNFSASSDGTSSLITWTSTASRLYTIETTTDLRVPSSWTDGGLGTFNPDTGATTTRNVTQPSGIRRFYRVKVMRPLP
jgi:Bacterial TSP3 repeat